ncbi:MAG: LysR family transcriptional regulator, partial [Archangium sp.]
MNLDELRAFLAVAETGSFFNAARRLKLSRATLRRRIDELEVRVGVPLLERTSLGASVTDAGALLAARGRLIVQEASTLLATISELGTAPSGLVRIMLPVGLPPHLLTPLFARVSSRYPRLNFRVRFGNDP